MRWMVGIWFFLLVANSCAQQTEAYTQYTFNPYAVNPAFGGTKSCPDIKAGNRLQWLGVSGAPITSFVSAHKAFGKRYEQTSSWHGLGAYIIDDRTGLYKRLKVSGSYAYHFYFSRNWIASFGLAIGGRLQSFKGTNDPTDYAINTSKSFLIVPDIDAGVLFYSKQLYFGASAKQLYKRKMGDFRGNTIGENSKSAIQIYAIAGGDFRTDHTTPVFSPSVLLKAGPNVPLSLEANAMMKTANERLGFGLGFRMIESAYAMLTLGLTRTVKLGYSYDFVINVLSPATSGTHELMLSWQPCKQKGGNYGRVDCPTF